MNIDKDTLRALAEACKDHQPLRFMRSHGALYIRNDNGIVFDVHQNRSFPDFMAQNKDYADLVLAASPATVLALLAEIERLSSARSRAVATLQSDANNWQSGYDEGRRMGTKTVLEERDQLRAENEALRKALGDLLALYEDDEGCRELPEYIAGRAAMSKGEQP